MNLDESKILDSLNQRVYVKNLNGIYVYVNHAFAELVGLDPTNVIGKSDYDMPWSSDAETFLADEKMVLNGGKLINVERYQKRRGFITKIMLSLTPYQSSDGSVCGVVGSFFDGGNHLIVETAGVYENKKLHLGFVNEALSSAEIRVCFYLLHNFTADRIAEKIGLSLGTVRFHTENIKNKMRCKTKNEITEVAMRTGIAWKIFSLQHQIED